MGSPFKLAMGQMLVSGGEPAQNLDRAVAMIADAARIGCAAIVLPECLDVGWTHPLARELAEPIPGPRSNRLCTAAERYSIYVTAGLTERAGERVYNSAILISDAGEIILKHRKINILKVAQDLYSTGDSLGIVDTPIGKLGVSICADNFHDSLALAHSMARMGMQILLSPCAWAVKPDFDHEETPYGATWIKPYTELAGLYDVTVVGVSNVGPISDGVWKGRKCIGCSLAVGPGGVVIARAPYGVNAEALLPVEVAPIPRTVTGTDISAMLEAKGCKRP